MTETFTIESRYNRISGYLVLPEKTGKYPCVILSHGLVSSKESSKYTLLSEVYEKSGIATCRFDFHGCGESGGNIEDTTLTIRLENLEIIHTFLLENPLIDGDRIGLLGSSFGGATSLVKASRDASILCSSFWATPYRLEEKEDEAISEIYFKKSLYADFASYDILSEASNVSRALVIHGDMDEVVPCSEGIAIYENLREPKACEIIKGGNHVLSDSAHRDRAIRISLHWFLQFFAAGK